MTGSQMDDRNPRWQRYLRLWGPDPDADLREEFRFHLETEVEELVARGVPVDEARDRALRRFGDLRHAAAACRVSDAKRLRRLRWSELADTVRHDVRYTVRGLVARPAFTATIVLTLALGVGANAAVFTIVDRVFLRPPEGVRDPASLHRLYTLDSRPKALVDPKLSLPEALDIQRAVGGEFPTAVYAS